MAKQPEPKYYTYDTAPDSPQLRGMGITPRQLKRAVETRRLSCIKTGLRVLFTEEQLAEFVEKSTLRAVK